MHGYPEWFAWAVMAIYALFYIAPAGVVLGLIWWFVRRRRK